MHTKYLFCLVALLVISAPQLIFAQSVGSVALKPFGGQVTEMSYCDEGLELWIQEPVVGGVSIVEPFIWPEGELKYQWFVSPHVKQWLVGWASKVTTPCTVSGTEVGFGYEILAHGESF